MSNARRQLIGFRFPPGSTFEGHLVGALQRIESGGTMRILDGLFVGRDADSELVAVSITNDGSAGMIGRLIGFRLDQATRRSATERALAGAAGDLVRALAETVEPGGAVAGLLVEHSWAIHLDETIARQGGEAVVDELVDATDISTAWSQVRARVA